MFNNTSTRSIGPEQSPTRDVAGATSVIEVDLGRLAHNMSVVREAVGPDVKICAVIKADAYGLGAVPIAQTLQALSVDMLAVYTPRQAYELVRNGITCRILVLMPLRQEETLEVLVGTLKSGQISFTVHDDDHLQQLCELSGRYGRDLPVHIEIDTGMSRGGMPAGAAEPILQRIAIDPHLKLAGVFTHFSCSESRDPTITERQLQRFHEFIETHRSLIPDDCILHSAGTSACLRDAKYHLKMVRVGLAWAGCTELNAAGDVPCLADRQELESKSEAHDPAKFRLLPIVRWTTRIVHVRWIEPGAPVGYGSTWTAPRPTRIGLVPVGYADGYPTALSNVGMVRIKSGEKRFDAPVVGRVSMDQITVDLTDVPDHAARAGVEVELIGLDPNASNHLSRLARSCEMIPHAILCGINTRIPRVYRLGSPTEPITDIDRSTPHRMPHFA
jgi:alanine racemase